MRFNADLSLRVSCNIHDIDWEDSPSTGVMRRRLEQDETPPIERVTTIVKFAAQSTFSPHIHTGGEEFLVLDGVFSDQHMDYPAGYYVRNPVGTSHTPHSNEGCTILVKLWQMRPDDQQQMAINTRDSSLWLKDEQSSRVLPLFNSDYESVDMLKWPSTYPFEKLQFEAGVEYFVLQGRFSDEQGTYTKGSWLRLPAHSKQTITVMDDCLLLRKTGHLLNPVPYA